MDETFRRVEEHLRPWARGATITPDTELCRDLGMYGDDLAFDVVVWAQREFGLTEGHFDVTDYGLGESFLRAVRRWLRRLLGMKERQYRSLTVRDVVAAIEAKRWPD